MYKFLLITVTLALISACAGTAKDDGRLLAAEDSYNDAHALITEARSYGLTVDDAENKLSQAGLLIKEEKYDESITASQAASKSASEAISEYQLAQEKRKADKLAKEEADRLAAATKLRDASASTHVVQAGDSLWSIARSSRVLGYDPLLWPLIFADNQSVIDDPDLITPGMALVINKTDDTNRLKKARTHAQQRGNWSLGSREESDQIYLQ